MTIRPNLQSCSSPRVSIWLDDLSRRAADRRQPGRLVARPPRRRDHDQPDDLREGHPRQRRLRRPDPRNWRCEASAAEALRPLTASDVRWACDVLRPVYDATDGVDGRVSIEVDPRLAHDTDATIAEARALWWLVDRPNLFVKIPATQQGLPAISACLAEGISINVTLIFSLQRYAAVIDAFLDGMERARSRRARPVHHRVRGLVLRQPGRHRDRPAPGQDRHRRRRPRCAAGPRSPTPGWPTSTTSGCSPADRWRRSGSGRRPSAAAAVGLDRRQGSRLRRHPVRRRPGRPRRGQHHARGHPAAVADHGDDPRRHHPRPLPDAHQVLHELAAVGVDYDDVVDLLEHQGVRSSNVSGRGHRRTQRPPPRHIRPPSQRRQSAAHRQGARDDDRSSSSIVGGGLAGAKAAQTLREEGFDGPDRADRGRSRTSVRTPAPVQGLPAGQGRPRHDLRPPGAAGTPTTTSSCASASAVTAHRPRAARTVTLADGEPHRLRQAAAGHRFHAAPPRRCRAPTSTACSTCARVERQRPDQGRASDGARIVDRRRRLDRPGDAPPPPATAGVEVTVAGGGRAAAAAGARPRGRPRLRRPAPRPRRGPAVRRRRCSEIAGAAAGSPVSCWPTAAAIDGRRGRRRRRRSPRTPSWPRRPACRSTTASSSTQRLRTSDPDIYAAGDVANAFHPLLGRHIRVEHWANALQPGRRPPPGPCSARTSPTTGCRTSSPTSTTWAWSTPATSSPAATTRSSFRGDRRPSASSSPSGSASGRVLAGMNVNVWDVNDAIQALVRDGRPVDPARLSDPGVPLEEVAG